MEASNAIVMHKHRYQGRHVVELYERLRPAKNHGKAAVAVARHLAEASWWMLAKKQAYRELARHRRLRPRTGQRGKAVWLSNAVRVIAKPGTKMLMLPRGRIDD